MDSGSFRASEEVRLLRRKNRELLKSLAEREDDVRNALDLKDSVDTFRISVRHPSGFGEAVAVMVASDWHVEEKVRASWVNGLNSYSPKIAKERAESFFKNGLRLLTICKRDVEINSIVLALLGDFFTGEIHAELAGVNAMAPMDACIYAQNLIASGIEFLLKQTECNVVIPCCVGN